MGNNASLNRLNSKQIESRDHIHRRHRKLPSTSASEETLGGRQELRERSRRASSSVATLLTSNNSGAGRKGLGSKEKVPSKVSFKPVRSSKSKSIYQTPSAPQAEASFDDTRNEDHVKSSKQNLPSLHNEDSPRSANKFRDHFKKRRHNSKPKDTNNNNCNADTEEDSNETKEEQVRPPSRRSSVKTVKSKTPSVVLRGVRRCSKTVVQDVEVLNDRKITVQVQLTSAAAGEDVEKSEKLVKDPQHHERLCHKDSKKNRDKGDSSPAESFFSDEGQCESKEPIPVAEIPKYEAPPKDPTIESPLLHKINKDIKMMVVRQELLKSDPAFQKMYRANPLELILTNLPVSTNIADVNRAFQLAVGIRLEMDNQSHSPKKSKVAKIIFENQNDATEAYVIGKQTKIRGKDVNFQS